MVTKEILFHAYLKGGTIIFLLIDKIRNNCWEDIFLSYEPLQEVNEKNQNVLRIGSGKLCICRC